MSRYPQTPRVPQKTFSSCFSAQQPGSSQRKSHTNHQPDEQQPIVTIATFVYARTNSELKKPLVPLRGIPPLSASFSCNQHHLTVQEGNRSWAGEYTQRSAISTWLNPSRYFTTDFDGENTYKPSKHKTRTYISLWILSTSHTTVRPTAIANMSIRQLEARLAGLHVKDDETSNPAPLKRFPSGKVPLSSSQNSSPFIYTSPSSKPSTH